MTASNATSNAAMPVWSRLMLAAALIGAAIALMAGAYVETASLALPVHLA